MWRSVAGVLFVVALLPQQGLADDWKRHGGTCSATFAKADQSDPNELKKCFQLWMSYRDLNAMSREEKSTVGTAAAHMLKTGDREGQHLARTALMRLGFAPPAPTAAEAAKPGAKKPTPAPAVREKYAPEYVSAARQKKAQQLNTKGFKAYKKGKQAEALKLYEQAIQSDPRCAACIYNAACVLALRKNSERAFEYLQRLTDLGTKDAARFLQAARVDDDWRDYRDNPKYRELTGYVRVKVVNSLGEYGEEETQRIVETIRKLRHHIATVGADKAENRVRPIIWYKNTREARNAAYIFEKVIRHPKVKFNMIDWETESDVIISWGDVIKETKRGDPIIQSYGPKDPSEAEKELDDLMFEGDKALIEKENTGRKVDRAIDTPDRMRQRGENAVNRVERTRDQIENTIEKIQKPFK